MWWSASGQKGSYCSGTLDRNGRDPEQKKGRQSSRISTSNANYGYVEQGFSRHATADSAIWGGNKSYFPSRSSRIRRCGGETIRRPGQRQVNKPQKSEKYLRQPERLRRVPVSERARHCLDHRINSFWPWGCCSVRLMEWQNIKKASTSGYLLTPNEQPAHFVRTALAWKQALRAHELLYIRAT